MKNEAKTIKEISRLRKLDLKTVQGILEKMFWESLRKRKARTIDEFCRGIVWPPRRAEIVSWIGESFTEEEQRAGLTRMNRNLNREG